MVTIAYRCPVCGGHLADDTTGYICALGHRFDRAREGYVNLLLGGRLKGRPSGDDDSMVRARRTVFDAGLYDPIITAVAGTVATAIGRASADDDRQLQILDCGCGEGAYLAAVTATVDAMGWGIDVSRPAIRLAARRHRQNHHAVASSYQLPFDDGSFDASLSVFAPRPHGEMMRVLRDRAVAVIVRPGPDHLAELKALVYDDPRQHREPSDDDSGDWPPPSSDTTTVTATLQLDDPVLRTALLEMTPFWWSTRPERRAAIAAALLSVRVDVRISVVSPR